ncbi:MAG: hypothetical protein NXI10_01230 [bacterium]|nr:hypothetical protein [bacterium]
MERDKVIALIAEDIKHNRLLNGLDSIGLNDNDRYTLSLDLVIADMMGYPKGKVSDNWLEMYHKTMLSITNDITPKEAHRRAINLFEALSNIEL